MNFMEIQNMLMNYKKQFSDANLNWEITIEDKILLNNQKGIIGSHTQAEMIAAAKIAAYQIFPNSLPQTTSPKTARAGLDLNKTGSDRKSTKESVLSFVKKHAVGFKFFGNDTDEDCADAFVLALHSVRTSIKRELKQDSSITTHFSQCHSESLRSTKISSKKLQFTLEEQINSRMSSWIDEVWLFKQFPID